MPIIFSAPIFNAQWIREDAEFAKMPQSTHFDPGSLRPSRSDSTCDEPIKDFAADLAAFAAWRIHCA